MQNSENAVLTKDEPHPYELMEWEEVRAAASSNSTAEPAHGCLQNENIREQGSPAGGQPCCQEEMGALRLFRKECEGKKVKV